MTIKSGTGQACAACKYQRRRCTPECLLAPFFPADQPKMFQNVHRLFGVKNIQNLLKELGPDQNQKAMAMKSIKFHASMRDKYPVYGCLAEIQQLYYQIQVAEEELRAVVQQLTYYRQQQQQHQQQQEMSSPTAEDYISELQLGMAPPGNAALAPSGYALPQVSYSDSANGGDYNISYLDFKDQTFSNSNEHNPNVGLMQPSHLIMAAQQSTLKQESTAQDYNEMQPFFDNIDDSQSFIGSKEAYESSIESTSKDSRTHLVEEMDENELKSAAACFSLISIN